MEDTAHAQFHILYLLVPWCVQGPGMATGNSYSRNNRAFFHEGKYTEHKGIKKNKKCVLALNIKAKIVTQLQRKNSLKHISVY